MSAHTSKGIPVPDIDGSDTFDVPADINELAAWLNDHPGVASITTTERNLLAGPAVWAGKVIYNKTTAQLEINKTGAAGETNWAALYPTDELPAVASLRTLGTGAQQAAPGGHTHGAGAIVSGTFDLSRLPVAASGTSSALQIVRSDDARLSDQRVPTDGSVTENKVATAIKDGAVATASMRTLGTGAQQAAAGNHTHPASATTSGTFDIARLPVAADGASSSTTVVRSNDTRLKAPHVQIFAPGVSTWTKPAGATRHRVILIGGGGAGEVSAGSARGGGGGAIIDTEIPTSILGPTATVTVGAGGTNPAGLGGSTTLATIDSMFSAGAGYGGTNGGSAGWGGFAFIGSREVSGIGGRGGTAYDGTPLNTPGAGAGASQSDPAEPMYDNGHGADGRCSGAGDVRHGLAGAGGFAPGGGGQGSTTGVPGAAGAACIVSYFD